MTRDARSGRRQPHAAALLNPPNADRHSTTTSRGNGESELRLNWRQTARAADACQWQCLRSPDCKSQPRVPVPVVAPPSCCGLRSLSRSCGLSEKRQDCRPGSSCEAPISAQPSHRSRLHQNTRRQEAAQEQGPAEQCAAIRTSQHATCHRRSPFLQRSLAAMARK